MELLERSKTRNRKVMNPEVNQEIQDLKKQVKELNQLIKTLVEATEEGIMLSSDSLIIKMLKIKLNER